MGTEKSAFDRSMMRFALRAARRGRPSPNPHVGAVIAHGSHVIAVGHHERAGEAHAEVAALRRAAERARGATLYVTLEPCNHHGRTGPCTEAIVAAGIVRVVVGCRDPKPHVPGALERLSAAGIEITVPLCASEAESTIADFTKHFVTGLPFVTLLAGVSAETELTSLARYPRAIDPLAARRVARVRAASDAVLCELSAFAREPAPNCLRVLLDSELELATGVLFARSASLTGTLIFHRLDASPTRASKLCDAGAELHGVNLRGAELDLVEILRELGRRDVVRLLVEGSATLAGALVDLGQLDRVLLLVPNAERDTVEVETRARNVLGGIGIRSTGVVERGHDCLLECKRSNAIDIAPLRSAGAMPLPGSH